MSKLFVDEIVHQSSQGSGTITIGASGETINIVGTLQNNGADVGEKNKPAFFATLGTQQSLSDNTWTKIQIDTELFDTDNCFASYKFTPNVAGKYYLFGQAFADPGNASDLVYGYTAIYKNGSFVRYSAIDFRNNYAREATVPHHQLFEANGSTDYFELYANVNSNDGSGQDVNSNNTYFGGYLVTT